MPTTARVLPALTVVVMLMAVSGCAATTAGPPPVVAASPTTSDPTTSHPSPTPVATTPPPTAADGTDLAACADGVCEVRIDGPTVIPVPRRGACVRCGSRRAGPGCSSWSSARRDSGPPRADRVP